MSELEYRAAQVAEVSWPKRLIELIVMPYEAMTQVAYHGRMIEEVVTRGAFDGVERRTSQIKVNLDHRREAQSTVGRAVALHPSRAEGLVAEVKIFERHPMGDATLELADEESLGASAGFTLLVDERTGKARAGAEVWETRSRRRLNHLWLDHIAMTPAPAYEDARVLSVRDALREAPQDAPETPNLDRFAIERQRALYAAIDRRYGLGS